MKGITSTSSTQGVPVFQGKVETVIGGFRLDISNLDTGAEVTPGMPLGFDESTRIAKVVKLAIVQANATNTATSIQVKKGHLFKVGDYVAVAVGGAAYAISAIDTSNAAYDVFTVGTTLGAALTADTSVLFQSSATGATAAVYSVTARGLNYSSVTVATGADVAAVIDGSVYERRIVGGVTAAVKSLLTKIFFSQSY
jgi:hydrogenase maturation factor